MDLALVALAVALLVTLLTAYTENVLFLAIFGAAFGVLALNILGVPATLAQDVVISMGLTFVALALTRLLMRGSGAQTVTARLPRRLPPL